MRTLTAEEAQAEKIRTAAEASRLACKRLDLMVERIQNVLRQQEQRRKAIAAAREYFAERTLERYKASLESQQSQHKNDCGCGGHGGDCQCHRPHVGHLKAADGTTVQFLADNRSDLEQQMTDFFRRCRRGDDAACAAVADAWKANIACGKGDEDACRRLAAMFANPAVTRSVSAYRTKASGRVIY